LTHTINRCQRRYRRDEPDGVPEAYRHHWACLLALHAWERLRMGDLNEILLILDNVADIAKLNAMLDEMYLAGRQVDTTPDYLRNDSEFRNGRSEPDGNKKLSEFANYTKRLVENGERTAGKYVQHFEARVLVIMNQDPKLEDGFHLYPMPPCSPDDSRDMLSRYAENPELKSRTNSNVEELLSLLEHFPLFVAQAGRTIHLRHFSAEDYKDRLLPPIAEFQDATETLDIPVATKNPHPVAGATVELTRRALDDELKDERARQVAECALNVCAYLACDGIPAYLLYLPP